MKKKRIGIEVLHHLREIDARKLFASLGFSSLFLYCTQELKYSEGGAYRRIAAMRLLRDVPEYEEKLQSGAVSVATLSQVQSFLVQEKDNKTKPIQKKRSLSFLKKWKACPRNKRNECLPRSHRKPLVLKKQERSTRKKPRFVSPPVASFCKRWRNFRT